MMAGVFSSEKVSHEIEFLSTNCLNTALDLKRFLFCNNRVFTEREHYF